MASAAVRAAVAGLASILLAGCASLQLTNTVQFEKPQAAGGAGAQNVPLPIPVPPGPGRTPQDIVSGFLAASASFAGDPALARQYLLPTIRNEWQPGKWAVTVVSPHQVIKPQPPVPHAGGGPATDEVTMTGGQVATLTRSGQYIVSSGQQVYRFQVTETSDGWRISQLPQQNGHNVLLLGETYFPLVYQPADLYFPSASSKDVFVPDPVFVPVQETAYRRAQRLVSALRHDPEGWLAGAAVTAFPPDSKVLVAINGSIAAVSLQGAAARGRPAALARMAEQLVLTLTSSSYSATGISAATGISSVQLTVGKQPWRGGAFLGYNGYAQLVPGRSAAGIAYFPVPGGVRMLSATGPLPAVLPLPPRLAKQAFTAIAVSPASPQMFAGCWRRSIFVSQFRKSYRMPALQPLPGRCSSLSWDASGNLWVAAGGRIWLLPPGSLASKPVVIPALPASDRITDFQVAPDGTRAAMVVGTGAGAEVFVAAISSPVLEVAYSGWVQVGSDIADPAAVSWLNADHLIVLSQPAGAAAQLFRVPVIGGSSVPVPAPPGTVSVAADGMLVVTGTQDVKIWTATGINAAPRQVAAGSLPVFPG